MLAASGGARQLARRTKWWPSNCFTFVRLQVRPHIYMPLPYTIICLIPPYLTLYKKTHDKRGVLIASFNSLYTQELRISSIQSLPGIFFYFFVLVFFVPVLLSHHVTYHI